jgi:hypothetical protein
MAFPTDTYTATDLAEFIPEVWGDRINDFFKRKLVLGNFFTDRSEELADGGDTLHTPNLTEMSANAKSNGAAVTLNSPTETGVSLVVDQWYEVSFAIEDKEAAQVKKSYRLQETLAKNAGYTIAKKLDDAIAALFSGFSQTVGSSTTNVADSDIRAAIATLESANIDTSESAFFFHPNVFWRQLQSIDRFALAVNAPVQDPVAKRPMASLYGIPVYVTTAVPYVSGSSGRRNLLASSDAIHFATASLPKQSPNTKIGEHNVRIQSNYVPQYLSTITTADILYGVVENRDGAAVQILSHATSA